MGNDRESAITSASVQNEFFFKKRMEGVTLFNTARSSEIKKPLNIEPLLLQIERSQPKWFGYVSRMSEEKLPIQALLVKANGRRPFGRSPKQKDRCNGRL